ncbi:MAG: carbamoyl-phosphate synthase large subunit [Pseudomonadota bacterium]
MTPRRPFLVTLALVSAACSAPSSANPAMTPPPSDTWPGAEIVEGVAFQGDGSISLARGEAGLPVLSYWRPILFREDTDKPVAGRMDCKIVGLDQPFDEAAFDPDARHAAVAEARAAQGFKDMDRLRGAVGKVSDHIRQLDVVGRRANPRQHYVLSYILVRDGERLVDIRRNCTFVYGKAISRPDVLPYVYRYTKLSYAFEPGAS